MKGLLIKPLVCNATASNEGLLYILSLAFSSSCNNRVFMLFGLFLLVLLCCQSWDAFVLTLIIYRLMTFFAWELRSIVRPSFCALILCTTEQPRSSLLPLTDPAASLCNYSRVHLLDIMFAALEISTIGFPVLFFLVLEWLNCTCFVALICLCTSTETAA